MKTEFFINAVNPPSKRPIGWLVSVNLLKLLHELLVSYSLIAVSYDDFKKHFKANSSSNLDFISWYGETTQILYLFDLLIVYKCIPNHDAKRHKLVADHFCNYQGFTYIPKNLGSLFNQISNNSRGVNEINEIFDKLIEKGLKPINYRA